MKGCGEKMPLPDQHRVLAARGEGLDFRAGSGDARSPDEDHFQRTALEFGRRAKDRRVDLATVSVALDGNVERAKGLLRGVLDILRQEDDAGTGAEGRGLL